MARHSSGQALTGKKARARFKHHKEVHGRAKRNGNNASRKNGNGNGKNGSRGGR